MKFIKIVEDKSAYPVTYVIKVRSWRWPFWRWHMVFTSKKDAESYKRAYESL